MILKLKTSELKFKRGRKFRLLIFVIFNLFIFSYITTDKFYIEPNGKSEVLVIDRITQETSVQGSYKNQ